MPYVRPGLSRLHTYTRSPSNLTCCTCTWTLRRVAQYGCTIRYVLYGTVRYVRFQKGQYVGAVRWDSTVVKRVSKSSCCTMPSSWWAPTGTHEEPKLTYLPVVPPRGGARGVLVTSAGKGAIRTTGHKYQQFLTGGTGLNERRLTASCSGATERHPWAP
eukprot:351224-Chlamydomonas_euryale.AAC.1